MKRLTVAVALALAASPLLANPLERAPTDPIGQPYAVNYDVRAAHGVVLTSFEEVPTDPVMHASFYGENAAQSGTIELSTQEAAEQRQRHVERQPGYFPA